MEFPAELRGQKIVCPHCNVLTTLGQPIATPPPIPAQLLPSFRPEQNHIAHIKTKSEFIGSGCLVQLIGLCIIWIFPIGTVIGILLLLLGSRLSLKYQCSQCGNPVADKKVKLCPACNASFR